MAFSDPQSINPGSGAVSLPRTGSGLDTGKFTSSDGLLNFRVSHQFGKRTRRTARLDVSKIVTDPLNPSQNRPVSGSVYVVVDVPPQGFTADEQVKLLAGLSSWLTASTNANAIKLAGGES